MARQEALPFDVEAQAIRRVLVAYRKHMRLISPQGFALLVNQLIGQHQAKLDGVAILQDESTTETAQSSA